MDTNSTNQNSNQNISKTKTVSKENSYTYWVDNRTKNVVDPSVHLPQKIENTKEIENIQKAQQNVGSAWNSVGTWEEKTIKTDILKKMLEDSLLNYISNDGLWRISKIKKLEGESKIIYVRNKKRFGFDVKVEIGYKGISAHSEVPKGTIKLWELTDYCDAEYEHKVVAKKTGDKTLDQICSSSVRKGCHSLKQKVFEIFQEMKNQL